MIFFSFTLDSEWMARYISNLNNDNDEDESIVNAMGFLPSPLLPPPSSRSQDGGGKRKKPIAAAENNDTE